MLEQLKFNQHVPQHIVYLVAFAITLYFAYDEEIVNFEGCPCTPQNWWHTKNEYEARHGPSMFMVFCLVFVYVTLRHPLFPMPKINNIIKRVPFMYMSICITISKHKLLEVVPNLETMFTTREILTQVCVSIRYMNLPIFFM